MAATYSTIGHVTDHEHLHEGDVSYDAFRYSALPSEKKAYRVSFQIPRTVTTPLQELSTKLRQGHNYRQIESPSRRLWNPFWLSGLSLVLFATWYTLLIVATVSLYLFSARNSGIVGQSYANRYSWTYGPTAVLALTLSLWSQVELWCKELTPWARMRKGPTPSSNGLLGDYFTKWPQTVLWNAFRDGDYSIWLSASGSFLLHLAVIVSTSVIILEPSAVISPLQFSISDAFVSVPPNITSPALSGNALVRYFGINSRNLSYPTGTSANLTIANFVPFITYPGNSTFLATVPGMSASLECEPLPSTNTTDITSQPWRSILAPIFTTNISVPSCNIIGVPIGMGLDHAPPKVDTLSMFQGWWNNYTCNDGLDNSQFQEIDRPRYGYKPVVEGFDDHRLVFVTSFVQWTALDGMNTSRHTWVQNYTGIICKPNYSISTYDVQLSPAQLHTKTPYQAQIRPGDPQKINGFSGTDLAALIKRDSYNSLVVTSAFRSQVATVTENRGYLRREDPFFVAMSDDGNISPLSNQTEMLQRIPETFSGVAAQAFQEYFTTSERRDIDGTIQLSANRLKVKALPTGLILTFLSLMFVISISLIFLKPWDCVPSNPHSIAAKVKYLATSPSIVNQLRALNGLNMRQVQHNFAQKRHQSTLGSDGSCFAIIAEPEALISKDGVRDRPPVQDASNVWWRPLNHRFWFVFLIMSFPLAIIAILQVLQHISDTRDGLRDATEIGQRRILITLIPAAILSIIAVSFQSMHFNVCLTAPFNALKQGGVSHSRSLTVSILGKISPHVFVLGLKHRLFIPCVTAVCVIVGAFLTIVVSGLYYIQDVPLLEPVTLRRSDAFNFTRQDLSISDNLAGVTTKLLFREGLPYPALTYNDLVFPAVQIEKQSSFVNDSYVDVQLPALRPKLECFPNDPNDITFDETITYADGNEPEATYQTSFNFPCPGNSSICHVSWGFSQLIQPDSSNFILGRALDVTTDDCIELGSNNYYSSQSGCPSLTFALGNTSFRSLNESAIQQSQPKLHGFICYAYMEEVQTKLTLVLPEYAISNATGKTPEPDESTARNLTFNSANYNGPIYTNALSTLFSALDGPNIQIDPFMDAMIRGKDNSKVTDFLDAEGLAKLVSRASDLYAAYMVSAVSSLFRVEPANFNDQDQSQIQPPDMLPGAIYHGMLSRTNRQRLKQDPGTKTALQVMLAFMTVLAVCVFLMTDRGLRLPTNPCSIAGTMLLLAGSETASRNIIPPGSEWFDDKRIWDGWLFSLGWWSDGQGKRFGIDIGNASTGGGISGGNIDHS